MIFAQNTAMILIANFDHLNKSSVCANSSIQLAKILTNKLIYQDMELLRWLVPGLLTGCLKSYKFSK